MNDYQLSVKIVKKTGLLSIAYTRWQKFKSNVFNVLGESSILKNILLTRQAVLLSNFLHVHRNDGLM